LEARTEMIRTAEGHDRLKQTALFKRLNVHTNRRG
jgi:hypothetical protein